MRLVLLLVTLLFTANCTTVVFQGLPENGPPHGKAWGHKKAYYYYPDAEVYWIAENNSYAVLEGGAWTIVRARPAFLTPSYYYVVVESNEAKPWMNHAVYKKKYPPGKIKIKAKKK